MGTLCASSSSFPSQVEAAGWSAAVLSEARHPLREEVSRCRLGFCRGPCKIRVARLPPPPERAATLRQRMHSPAAACYDIHHLRTPCALTRPERITLTACTAPWGRNTARHITTSCVARPLGDRVVAHAQAHTCRHRRIRRSGGRRCGYAAGN